MKNPIKVLQNIILKSNALEPMNILKDGEERLSVFDTDICTRIGQETGIAIETIDELYWANSKSDNEYLLSRLLISIDQLIDNASFQLKKYLEKIVINDDLNYWILVYNNIQSAYESLIIVRNYIVDYYTYDIDEKYRVKSKLRFAHINIELAEWLKSECIANLGMKDTTFIGNNETQIEVQTSQISPLIVNIPTQTQTTEHSKVPNVRDKEPIENEGELGQKHIQEEVIRIINAIKTGTQTQGKIEKIQYLGTVESLGLFISLLMEANLISSTNKKLISRVIADGFQIKDGDFSSETLYRSFTTREFDHNNTEFLEGALRKIRESLFKIKNK